MSQRMNERLSDADVAAMLEWAMHRPYEDARRCLAVLLRRQHNVLDYVIRNVTGLSTAEIEEWDTTIGSQGVGSLMNRDNPHWHNLWQTIEPSDLSDPTPHELFKLSTNNSGWLSSGISVRGLSHAHQGQYREDDFNFYSQRDWHFVAVADGAGSAPLSRVGARIAVQSALKSMATKFQDIEMSDSESCLEDQPLRQAMIDSLMAAVAAVHREAQLRERDFRELNSTLLLLAHHVSPGSQVLVTAQVGDGLIAAVQGSEIEPVSSPMHGQYAGETYFLSSVAEGLDPNECVQIHCREACSLLLVMTDGVADDFFPPERVMPKLVQSLYQNSMYNAGINRWLDLIRYRKRGSTDDRTLVVLFSPDVQE